ncbi:hypothetical protein TNCV_351321 [Trichonephila clavipes]|nr:hypothetical protein TNCV_351321 [Trichonephila clavipes]
MFKEMDSVKNLPRSCRHSASEATVENVRGNSFKPFVSSCRKKSSLPYQVVGKSRVFRPYQSEKVESLLYQVVGKSRESSVPSSRKKVESSVPSSREKVESSVPSSREKVESSVPSSREKVESSVPSSREKVESSVPSSREKVESSVPSSREKVESLLYQYIYGTFFGVFTCDLPYNLDDKESRVPSAGDDRGKTSTVTRSDLINSGSIEEISMAELPKLLLEISKENDERIQKAILNNQKRIELLSKKTDENLKEIVGCDEKFYESCSLEADKHVKVSTAEIDEYLKLSAAFNEQRVRLAAAIDTENFKKDIVDCLHKRNRDLIKDSQMIKLHSAKDYALLKIANFKRYKDLLSLALKQDKKRSLVQPTGEYREVLETETEQSTDSLHIQTISG